MSKESKLIRAIKTVEATVKKNSRCRSDRGLNSCFSCSIYDSCKSNNYDEKLAVKKQLSGSIINSWDIEKRVRNI